MPAVQAWAEHGVDVILDPVGQYLLDNLTVLGLGGRLVLIGLMGGAIAEANLGLLMMKRARVIGSTLRARPIGEKALVMDGLKRDVWPRLKDGSIKPVVEARFPHRAYRRSTCAHGDERYRWQKSANAIDRVGRLGF